MLPSVQMECWLQGIEVNKLLLRGKKVCEEGAVQLRQMDGAVAPGVLAEGMCELSRLGLRHETRHYLSAGASLSAAFHAGLAVAGMHRR